MPLPVPQPVAGDPVDAMMKAKTTMPRIAKITPVLLTMATRRTP